MKKLRNIISTEIRIRFYILRTFLFYTLFLFLNVSVFPESWKEYSLRELIGRLKYYTYAKVAQSLRKEYLTDQEQIWEDWNCTVPVPELPGPFFLRTFKTTIPSRICVGKNFLRFFS
ncbi:hypothetical protein LEP1GSC145_4079 [Leptospira interrogans serovar Djasiman str. LT1649]|nr:hypothetical protein LEP1GSC148_0654 [Leptospira interrogans serovar Canicola str. LT1962]EMM88776.1 hypothetical protein LEP1GSC145_4079 [Leptospira interrogans serovar Djasiman str. LT1649]